MAIAGVLLTGGRSTRYGRDKGPVFGPRVADVLRQVADPVHEIGPGWTTLAAVADPGEGPLRALACAPACGDALVLACDLPLVSAPLLLWLADQPGTAIPVVEGRAQPLCARYSQRTLALAATVVGRAMRDLLDAADDVTYLDTSGWDPALFADVDTPVGPS